MHPEARPRGSGGAADRHWPMTIKAPQSSGNHNAEEPPGTSWRRFYTCWGRGWCASRVPAWPAGVISS